MTARIVISCDGAWDDGRMPCRASLPTRRTNAATATGDAIGRGWRWHSDGRHLCPAHARSERMSP